MSSPPLPLTPTNSEPNTPTVDKSERIYAIGDIHGRFDLLIQLLAKIERDARTNSDARNVRIVFLGDYIDRGAQSREVLTALQDLQGERSPNLVFLLGNHEAAMEGFLSDPDKGSAWLEFGGLQTLESFGISASRSVFGRRDLPKIRDEFADAVGSFAPFFKNLSTHAISGDVLFSHAGFDPALPLEDQTEDAMVWGTPDFLTDYPLPGRRVVHGHFDDISPAIKPGRICVDTGAYYSGVLTAVRLDAGDAIISVREDTARDR